MTNDTFAKIRDLMTNEEFFNTVTNNNLSPDELNCLLKEYDADIHAEELVAFSEQYVSQMIDAGYITEDGEMSEDALETVSGGIRSTLLFPTQPLGWNINPSLPHALLKLYNSLKKKWKK